MISRPIVGRHARRRAAGTPGRGLIAGAMLELFALETLPVGASRYPEWGSASVVAVRPLSSAALGTRRRADRGRVCGALPASARQRDDGEAAPAQRRRRRAAARRSRAGSRGASPTCSCRPDFRFGRAGVFTGMAYLALAPVKDAWCRAGHFRSPGRARRWSPPPPRRLAAIWKMLHGTPGRAGSSSAALGSACWPCGPDDARRHRAAAAPRLGVRAAVLLRLLAIQGSWNYETLMGNGIAFCRRARAAPAPRRYRTRPSTTSAMARESAVLQRAPISRRARGRCARERGAGRRADGAHRALPHGALRAARQRRRSAGLGGLAARLLAARAGGLFGLGASTLAVVAAFLRLIQRRPRRAALWGLRAGWKQGLGVAASARRAAVPDGARTQVARVGGRWPPASRIPLALRARGGARAGPGWRRNRVRRRRARRGSARHGCRRASKGGASPLVVTRAVVLYLGGALMVERTVTIVNKVGLHARPAAEIVKLAAKFASNVTARARRISK